MGNGDEASRDGYKFCGCGSIQLTCRDNYTFFAGSLGISVEEAIRIFANF
jgi:putative chitinase